MSNQGLARELFDGPIDIVGDVHGEISALHTLRKKLGYDDTGRHPEGRRLVFVGDLGDRGEDSPAVVEWVRDRVTEGRAQAVLGNHDFNALEAAAGGSMKTELSWLFDEARPYSHHGQRVPQVMARGRRREDILVFFRSMPVALSRGGESPVRVVHAAWDQAMVDRLRHQNDVIAAHRDERRQVQRDLEADGVVDELERKLRHQNGNAVKRLTSGPEGRSARPVMVNDEPRWESRVPWWRENCEEVLCVVGHYWRVALPGESKYESLFDGLALEAVHGSVMCIDYSVGKRFRERMQHGHNGRYHSRLGALRLPEQFVFYDNAEAVGLLR